MRTLTAYSQYIALLMVLVFVGQYFIVNVHATNMSGHYVKPTNTSDKTSIDPITTDRTSLSSDHSIVDDSIADDNVSVQINHQQQCHMQSEHSIADEATATTSPSSSIHSCCGDDCVMMSCYLATAILDSNYPILATVISQSDRTHYSSMYPQHSSPLYRPPIHT